MVECPECGKEYKGIGNHWQFNPSHRPNLTQKQLEITTGLLMGDGCVSVNKKNCYLQVSTVSENYLQRLSEEFGVLSGEISIQRTAAESAKDNRKTGFNLGAKEENYSDIYQWRTRTHPKFNEFREWYSGGEKVWPEDIKLTPTVLKHWYVGDGSYENGNKNNRISIMMNNEVGNGEKIRKYFERKNLPVPSFDSVENNGVKKFRAIWDSEKKDTIFNYIGKPLPDFEYKWPKGCR